MRNLIILIALVLLSACAHSTPHPCTTPGQCEPPDQDLGEFDSDPRDGLSFSYSCYEKLPKEDTAVCRTSYGLTPEQIAIGKQNCAGIVFNHRCPTNPMLYAFGRHSRGDPSRPIFTYLYFGDRNHRQVLSGTALLGPDTLFHPGFLGRKR
jgi:hypothetical protein